MVEKRSAPICEAEFLDMQSKKRVVVRLWPPIFDKEKDWYYCLSDIAGLDGEGVKCIYGDDPFQAICLSFERFRRVLENQNGDFWTSRKSAPRMHFPKTIPWVYGSDVYDRLCKMVDDEVQKIEDKRTHSRDAGNREEP